jgi:serine/threonine protein kinase
MSQRLVTRRTPATLIARNRPARNAGAARRRGVSKGEDAGVLGIISAARMGCPDPNQLQAFLDKSAELGELPALRAHLAQCPDCRSLVLALAPERSAHGDAETLPATQAARHVELAAGARLGRYVVIGRIGAGGMGVVYTAHDPELDRKLAVKVLRVGERRDDAALQRRLQREAQALARLSHPNVTAVHDVGTSEHGVFIAMELVEGETLGHWLAHGQPWRTIVDIFVRAGRGLEAAHLAGLVHRDFKPDNVLVGRDGRVRVTDFGLARAYDAEATPSEADVDDSPLQVSLTRSGMLVGTPAYMAPEQMGAGSVDARSDIFSFCVSLYEALYRQRPFAGATLESIRAAIANNAVREPPPSDVPARVRSALRRGLRAAPAERFAAISELLTLLEEEARTRRPSRLIRLGLPTLALLALGTVALLMARRTPPPPMVSPPPTVAPPATRPAPPVAPAKVTLRITSVPPGATIYRVSDGVELGTTPFSQTVEPVSGVMRFVLKLRSYDDAPVVLPTDRDGERTIALHRHERHEAKSKSAPSAKPRQPTVDVKIDDPFGD